MLTANSKISHYRIVSKIGEGGMGEVYQAQDTHLNRKVALKVLPHDVIDDRERLRRFEQEARAASALNHPNIITIHEIGAEGDTHFIVTEFIEGETLRRKLRTRLEVGEAVDIATQIAAALDAAHRCGIVHRDIKPENLMLREDGLAKVLDFGLAKLVEREGGAPEDSQAPTRAQVRTIPGMVMGTVTYMSPEQARGQDVDARTDVFSLGVVLYEMLTGRPPFAGETASDVIAAILTSEPAPLAEETPAELQRIVRKSLRKKADERYQTARDVLIDLAAFKHEQDFTAELERSGIPTRGDQPAPKNAQSIHAASRAGHVTSGIRRRNLGIAVSLAALLLATLGPVYWFYNRRLSAGTQVESIAVLPFINDSGNSNVEYLSDGMTESLISSLSLLPNLSVKARSSVFRYKGREVDSKQIGEELNVQALLNGRMVQHGQELILYLELVDARTENVLWKETYERQMSNLVSLQSEIARDVSQKIRTKLSGSDEQRLAKNYTENTEAYQHYLKGQFHLSKQTGEDIRRAIQQFQSAIEKDPNYALAYVALTNSYTAIGAYNGTPTSETLPQAKAAIEHALRLDDSLAEAHEALGGLYFASLQWGNSEKEYRRAIELNRNTGHVGYSNLLCAQMRFDEALREIKIAQEQDPLSSGINANVGRAYYNVGELDAAVNELRRVITLDPNFPLAHLFLGIAYRKQHRFDEAIEELQKTVDLSARGSYAVSTLGVAYALTGRRAEALATVKELEEKYVRREANGADLANTYAALGEDDRAIAWLEKDFSNGNTVFLAYITNFYVHERLHNDPRYKDLLRRMGLPQ